MSKLGCVENKKTITIHQGRDVQGSTEFLNCLTFSTSFMHSVVI